MRTRSSGLGGGALYQEWISVDPSVFIVRYTMLEALLQHTLSGHRRYSHTRHRSVMPAGPRTEYLKKNDNLNHACGQQEKYTLASSSSYDSRAILGTTNPTPSSSHNAGGVRSERSSARL
jgi:hypothetical protein